MQEVYSCRCIFVYYLYETYVHYWAHAKKKGCNVKMILKNDTIYIEISKKNKMK